MYVILYLLVCIYLSCVGSKVVTTKSGPVRGRLVDEYGARYFAFTGIPYAESPAGERRFKAPVPKQPWNAVFDATRPGPVCPQKEGRHTRSQMKEDCLVLNVYVPVNTTERAVFVFIHGGGLEVLSGNSDPVFGPELLMQRGVILVTMNYRIGALGFLSVETEAAPGNAGLKDIVLALTWVKDNIESFGGNSDNIAIGGDSSAAYLTHCLMLSERTTGLFHKVILRSGSALSHKYFTRYPKTRAFLLGQYLGLPTNDTDTLINKLTTVDEYDIIRAQDVVPKWSPKYYLPKPLFLVSKENDAPDAILTKYPIDIVKSGIPQKVPVLTGFNSAEALYIMYGLCNKTITFDAFEEKLDCIIPCDIQYPRDSRGRKTVIKSIKDLYYQRDDKEDIVIDFISDTQYNYDIDYWIRIYKQMEDNNNVYYYHLDMNLEVNYEMLRFNYTHPKTSHGDDIGYLFLTSYAKQFYDNLSERTLRLIDMYLTYFVNFLNYSDPTPAFLNMTPNWDDCGQERSHFYISEQPEFRPYPPFSERMQFWADVYDEYYRYVENGGPLEIFML